MKPLPNYPVRAPAPLVSVVVPVFNEAEVLRELRNRIADSLGRCASRHEVIFVNDGSCDGGDGILDELAAQDAGVCVVHLTRNFGQQAAVQAGLVHARGDVLLVMDADLQDDPASLPAFLDEWQKGFDVVYALRSGRKENVVKRFLFTSFYRLLNRIASTPIPRDAGNFCLMDRCVADHVLRLPDFDRYFPGLRSWVGFRQKGIVVERAPRYDNRPRVSLAGLFRLAKTAIFSFSRVPLSVFYALSGLTFVLFVVLSAFALFHKLATGLAIPGWTSIVITSSLFSSLNTLGIAVVGEYVVRIYDQVRGRPLFLVARTINCDGPSVIRPTASERQKAA
jgi:dolichol-phosphate mannosyltransferase